MDNLIGFIVRAQATQQANQSNPMVHEGHHFVKERSLFNHTLQSLGQHKWSFSYLNITFRLIYSCVKLESVIFFIVISI